MLVGHGHPGERAQGRDAPGFARHGAGEWAVGVHQSVAQFKAAITGFTEQHNASPKPFRWTKSASDILASVKRFYVRTATTQAAQTGDALVMQRTSEPGYYRIGFHFLQPTLRSAFLEDAA